MNRIEGVKSYSMYPSPRATAVSDDYRVFRLKHEIPICESAAPGSSYRWHSMSEAEFSAYRNRLAQEVYDFMEEIEKKENAQFTLAIAHHSFLNPLVMRDVIARRVANGKPRTPLCCFLHGTGLKMFLHEMSGKNPEEYPMRFHKMLVQEKVFNDLQKGVSVCIANSPALFDQMKTIFPTFPQDRIFSSTPGVNSAIFHPRQLKLAEVLQSLGASVWPGQPIDTRKYDRVIILVGKLADWKRIDAMLLAAKKYGPNLDRTATLIVGGGPANELKKLTDLAEKLTLEHVYLMGPRSQDVLAQLFTVASVGVFPSFEEPFGMVFIECMACACPVIGANSGGPALFVTSQVGELVPEPGMKEVETLSNSLAEVIQRSIKENWKKNKVESGLQLVKEKFGATVLTEEMLDKALDFAHN